MSNPYLAAGKAAAATGGNPYLTAGRSSQAASASATKTGGGGGFFSRLGSNLESAALAAPGGLVHVASAVGADARDFIEHPEAQHGLRTQHLLAQIGESTAHDIQHPLRNPGYTLLDLLPVAGAASRVALAGKVAKAGEGAGASLRALTQSADKTLGPRVLTARGAQSVGNYSRSASGALTQKAVDALLQKSEGSTSKLGQLVENRLHGRAAKFNERNLRVAEAVARAPGTRVAALGRKLKPAEQRALRLVALEVPVERTLGALHMRAARSTGKELARHQERIALTTDAKQYLTEGPGGKPVFKPEANKLQTVFDAVKKASADRGAMLKNLDLFDEQAQHAAKTNAARMAAGGRYEKPTPGKIGKISAAARRDQQRVVSIEGRLGRLDKTRTTEQAQARLTQLEREHNAAVDKIVAGKFGPIDQRDVNYRTRNNKRAAHQSAGTSGSASYKSKMKPTVKNEQRAQVEQAVLDQIAKNPTHPAAVRWQARLDEIDQLRAALNPDIFEKPNRRAFGREPGTADPQRRAALEGALSVAREDAARNARAAESRIKPTGVVGAEDITVSPGAPFIGNPVERSRATGRPKVSSTGTFGHTRKPSSLKAATGGAVEHSLERNDVTNIVAERHGEAVRLSTIQRRVKMIERAGSPHPTRPDDVFMWTDKTVSQERIPAEVRKYLNDPEAFGKLPEGEKDSLMEQLKKATFERHNWSTDPEQRAAFEKLAAEGKGVFVPRRLLGDAGKRSPNVEAIPGVKFVDAVNNAQKAALIYLKLNYPIVQGLSNVGMGVIQQGFAYPVNLTKAARLARAIGSERTAVIDDIVGQGAVMQAAFHGEGLVSRSSQRLAHAMSHGVDVFARRAAFLHEAAKAGFSTPERLTALLEDDQHAQKLGEVAQRAKEAIVDYNELSPAERNLVRRLVFVYPWQKGATKYAGQFLRDHPVQAAAVGALGQEGQTRADQQLGPVPSYLKGVFDVNGGLVNPSGVNFFQTPAQIGRAAIGLATGNPARDQGQDFLSPAPAALVALLTGKNSIGQPLKGNLGDQLRSALVEPAPIAALARAAVAGNTSEGANLVRGIAGGRSSSQTFPNTNDAYWRFLLGGLYPRQYSRPALNKNAALEKTGR